jgi:hypothetical protein
MCKLPSLTEIGRALGTDTLRTGGHETSNRRFSNAFPKRAEMSLQSLVLQSTFFGPNRRYGKTVVTSARHVNS